ncbi:type II secretion system F family protein [Candidatus Chazhemtobacterium aquaticus]|jgi:type IV pilus assembly protein PilC|uniref:Type IV pilin biogenesis protein PulF/GspF/PilC n=1 Tax=Candidatus Chazhemtobacterium aquaticus TaxID=2715735 RepID=A0A857N8J8_9BACT|nr:type II secretion system F family protein [Candidatus Chazhemtobacterium aquaticus]QHO63669.1 Type IV pilin biogenesis protein PulF/GspF/PilC [Candidatus Chazhemtobacterium aquaticus]
MAKQFGYRVKNEEGKTLDGVLEASSLDHASKLLRGRGYLIIKVEEEKESEIKEIMRRFERVKVDDVVNFTRQLSTMVSAGLPLTESLSILRVQSPPAMSRVVSKVLEEVEGGKTLAIAMEESGDGVFDDIYIALVKAGEAAGVLDEVLKRLAETMEKQRDFRSKTKGAMVYPMIIIIGMVIVAVIMMIFVVPRMTEMYKDFGAELPLPTQILIGASDFAVKFWYLLLLIFGAIGYVFLKWSRTDVGSVMIEETLMKMPVVGELRLKMVMTEFARTMSLLISAGISILDALRITSAAVGSKIIGAKMMMAASKVEKGQSLGLVLAELGEFPPIVPQMIAVGEQTGKMDEILDKLADYFEGESEQAVKNLTTAIEPMIMAVMGVGVGFLVMAVIMPIYNLTSQF